MYNLIHFNCRTPIFPFVFTYQIQNRFNNYFFYNTPYIGPCASDETFLWVTHSDVTPNIVEYRYLVSNYGRVFDCYKNNFVTQVSKHNRGYRVVYLYHYKDLYNVESLNIKLHRLVAYYFLYFKDCDLLEVNHINGIKHDNRVCNLEWVTRKENMQHALKTGLVPLGEKREGAPISDKEADKICRLIMEGKSNSEISKIMNVPVSLVLRIKTGESYVNISANYPNLKDMIIESSPNLTEEKVHEICKLVLKGYTPDKIAELIGCTKTQVLNVRRGRNYTEISSQYNLENNIRLKRHVSEETIHAICKDMEDPRNTNSVLSKKYDVSDPTISQIRTGKKHTDISSQYNIIKYDRKETKRLSVSDIEGICQDLENGLSCTTISKNRNIDVTTILRIKNKRVHTNISDKYSF